MCTTENEQKNFMEAIQLIGKKRQTITRGYRLKNSTHNLIKKLQADLNKTHDKIISSALRNFYLKKKN